MIQKKLKNYARPIEHYFWHPGKATNGDDKATGEEAHPG